jgi:hypothetical protein
LREACGLLENAHAVLKRGLSVSEAKADEAERLAIEYEKTAALYRRRAARRPEEATRLRERAEWFEARARFKRTGEPLPRAVRTPSETAAAVDKFRQLLLLALEHARELAPSDLAAFAQLLVCVHSEGPNEADLTTFYEVAEKVLRGLGVEREGESFAVAPFQVPIAYASSATANGSAHDALDRREESRP